MTSSEQTSLIFKEQTSFNVFKLNIYNISLLICKLRSNNAPLPFWIFSDIPINGDCHHTPTLLLSPTIR